jgi:hypothetical protein
VCARLAALLLVLIASVPGCSGCSGESWNAPSPVESTDLPDDLEEALERTDGGLPILITSPPIVTGVAVDIAYDETLDDPITRWGECLARVTGCYDTNAGRLGGCVDMIEICADEPGGKGCCPKGCISAYKAARDDMDEDTAVRASFVLGDCIPGFAALRDEAEVDVEVQP